MPVLNGHPLGKKCTISHVTLRPKWDSTRSGLENAHMGSKVVFGPKQLIKIRVKLEIGFRIYSITLPVFRLDAFFNSLNMSYVPLILCFNK